MMIIQMVTALRGIFMIEEDEVGGVGREWWLSFPRDIDGVTVFFLTDVAHLMIHFYVYRPP